MLYYKRREKRNPKNGRGLIKSEDCKNKKEKEIKWKPSEIKEKGGFCDWLSLVDLSSYPSFACFVKNWT